ncbi:hypothetical protein BDR22DRAFT_885716 [Usnea florida]
MATTTPCEPSSEEFTTHLVTVRILAAVGFTYLLKVLYHLIKERLFSHRSPLGTHTPDATAEENIGMSLDDYASTSQLGLELDFDGFDNGDLGIRVPEPAYHPRDRL